MERQHPSRHRHVCPRYLFMYCVAKRGSYAYNLIYGSTAPLCVLLIFRFTTDLSSLCNLHTLYSILFYYTQCYRCILDICLWMYGVCLLVGIGPAKSSLGAMSVSTAEGRARVARAHSHNLAVHVWTFRWFLLYYELCKYDVVIQCSYPVWCTHLSLWIPSFYYTIDNVWNISSIYFYSCVILGEMMGSGSGLTAALNTNRWYAIDESLLQPVYT